MKKIAVLGSTGSVGSQTLEIVRKYKNDLKVELLGASKISDKLLMQIEEFKPSYVYVENLNGSEIENVNLIIGEENLKDVLEVEVDLFINAISGIKGILPTYYILNFGKKLATANKEAIICLGEIEKEKYKNIFPLDSEHSAIFQILSESNIKEVRKIILTASGGPFLNRDISKFDSITVEEALNHPKWKMGKKITIDSATLINKGFEVIEAHYLFSFPYEKIDIIIHPDSIIHGMVEFLDGTVISNMSNPDMKIPISYALFYPERRYISNNYLDFRNQKSITFFEPDLNKFPLLKISIECGKKGGYYPIVLTVADEIAVNMFLENKIKFTDIHKIINNVLDCFDYKKLESIEDIFNIIKEVEFLTQHIGKKYGSS